MVYFSLQFEALRAGVALSKEVALFSKEHKLSEFNSRQYETIVL